VDDKQAMRERVWARLREARVARFPGARGRIPNFVGAERAAAVLAKTREWTRARTLKANPDAPQWPVRTRALSDGKTVYMAVPKLASEKPFIELDPGRLEVAPRAAASIKASSVHGRSVSLDEMPHIDLIVCGSVAVNRRGTRIGKGGGYSDLEFALGTEHGLIDERTVIATTVHPLQVLDEELPETEHDFRADLIVTPEEVIRCRRARRPAGIILEHQIRRRSR
jgi:5-formyltetrahydrofolate cyclo-ligase